jgi:hypothetical protein
VSFATNLSKKKKNNLWRHARTCSARSSHSAEIVVTSGHQGVTHLIQRQGAVSRSRWVLNSALFQQSDECFGYLMQRMHDDGLKSAAMNDPLIRCYATMRMQSFSKQGSSPKQKRTGTLHYRFHR